MHPSQPEGTLILFRRGASPCWSGVDASSLRAPVRLLERAETEVTLTIVGTLTE